MENIFAVKYKNMSDQTLSQERKKLKTKRCGRDTELGDVKKSMLWGHKTTKKGNFAERFESEMLPTETTVKELIAIVQNPREGILTMGCV